MTPGKVDRNGVSPLAFQETHFVISFERRLSSYHGFLRLRVPDDAFVDFARRRSQRAYCGAFLDSTLHEKAVRCMVTVNHEINCGNFSEPIATAAIRCR
jgi:hypothetical protein